MRSVNTCTRLTTRRDPSWTSITVIMDSGPRGGGFAQQWDDAMWLSHGAVWVFSLFPRRVGRCELEARWLLFRCHPGCALALHWLRQIKKQLKHQTTSKSSAERERHEDACTSAVHLRRRDTILDACVLPGKTHKQPQLHTLNSQCILKSLYCLSSMATTYREARSGNINPPGFCLTNGGGGAEK